MTGCRISKPILALCAALLVGLASVASAAEAPIVFRVSDPTGPGDTALIYGHGLAAATGVRVWRLPDAAPGQPGAKPTAAPSDAAACKAIQPCTESVKFVVPNALKPGVSAVQVQTPAGASNVALMNHATLWWAQGDAGANASPGGWIRAFGKCLAVKGRQAQLLLRGPKQLALAAKGDEFALRVDVPKGLPAGEYALLAHNGCGGPAGWSQPVTIRIETPKPWPSRVFNIMDYRANGRGERDDTQAVKDALADIEKAGGGVLYFPRGRYMVTDTIRVPRYAMLRGEARVLVNIFWPDQRDPLPAMIQGTNSFALQDLTLYASNYAKFVVADQAQPDAGNVRIQRVCVRASRYRGHIKPEEADRRFRKPGGWATPMLNLGGRNVVVTDCDLYSSGMSLACYRLQGAVIARNVLYNGRHGWYSLDGSDGLILEDNQIIGNDLMSTGGSLNCYRSAYSQHVYYARNKLSLMHGWDREALTSDAGGGAYFGKIKSAQGAKMLLADDLHWGKRRDWTGAGVFIYGGKGVGQYRRVAAYDGPSLTVDRPWDVAPDASSQIEITQLQRQYIIVGNEFSDAGIAVQFYGTSIEHIVAGNTATRAGGFIGIGKQYSGYQFPPEKAPTHQPSWFCQFLGNEILEGNCYRFSSNNSKLSGDSVIGAFGWVPKPDWPWAYNRGTIIRGNVLHNNARIEVGGPRGKQAVVDCIVEHNTVRNADVGVKIDKSFRRVALRANRFENVALPVTAPDPAAVGVHPAQAFGWTLQHAASMLGSQAPDWSAILKQADELSKQPMNAPAVAVGLRDLRVAAFRSLAGKTLRGRGKRALGVVFELFVRPEPTHGIGNILDTGRGGASDVGVRVALGTDLPGLSARLRVRGPNGDKAASGDVAIARGKPAAVRARVNVPRGTWGVWKLPLEVELSVGRAKLTLVDEAEAGTGAVRQWFAIGPFPNKSKADFDTVEQAPEKALDVNAPVGELKWRHAQPGSYCFNLGQFFKPGQPAVAYALAGIWAERETDAVLTTWHLGGAQVWLNARLATCSFDSVGVGAPVHTDVRLRKGANFLLIKSCRAKGKWQISAKIRPKDAADHSLRVMGLGELRKAKDIPAPRAPLPESMRDHFPPAVQKIAWRLVIEDDFDRKTIGPNWRTLRGSWRIEAGAAAAEGAAFLAYAKPLRAPIKIEYFAASAKPGDLSCFYTAGRSCMGGYLLGFGANGNTLDKVVRQGEEVQRTRSVLIEPGRMHHVVAVLLDGYLGMIVDGKLALEYRDPKPLTGLDTAGIYAWSNARFDKVRIFTR